MWRGRILGTLGALAAIGALLVIWAGSEARTQRRETEEALRAGATVLARSLVPALAGADAAATELDEVVSWKILDNARLLGHLDAASSLTDAEILHLLEENGLEAVVLLDKEARIRRAVGKDLTGAERDPKVRAVAAGRKDSDVLGWTSQEGHGLVAAVAARPGGGAVLASTDAATAYAFARRLGVPNLLENMVGTGGVLYLAFDEGTGEPPVMASWDGGPVPERPSDDTRPSTVRGRSVYELRFPVPVPAGRSALLRVGLDAEPLRRAGASATRRTALVGAALAAFALAVAGVALVIRSRGLEREQAARRLASAEEARRHSERLAAAGALSAGVAHEVRNPLNAISLAAQRIERRHPEDAECRTFAGRIRAEVARLEEIVKGFLDLARPATGPRQATDLSHLAREVAALLEEEASGRDVRLVASRVAGAVARADGEAVRRALLNLVRNALEASPAGGTVEVLVEPLPDRVRIRVRDEGGGLDGELAGRAFDPFVTTRAEGTGLGLPLVRRVAEEHGGRVTLENRPGGGAEALLEIDRGGGEA